MVMGSATSLLLIGVDLIYMLFRRKEIRRTNNFTRLTINETQELSRRKHIPVTYIYNVVFGWSEL